MNSLKQHNFLVILILIFTSAVYCQNNDYPGQELARPFLKYYSPKTYKAASENWCIIRDKRGVMYFGNQDCILEFDGNTWRKIETPYSSDVRTMAMDKDGKIYLCAFHDFGYLQPDSIGQLKFVSLKNHLPDKYKNTGEIWDVNVNSEGVYFKTADKVFRWNGKSFSIWDSVFSFRLYKIDDNMYVRNQGKGIMQIKGDSIYVIPGGEYFKSIGVFNMLPFPGKNSNGKNQILITTNSRGLFLYDGVMVSQFKTEADSFFYNNQVYNACILYNGIIAVTTQRGGAAIIDREGHLIKILNENSGLATNTIYNVYPDKQGGLWLATNDGIIHTDVISPLSFIPAAGILKNQVYSILHFKNTLYVCNDLGVLYLKNGSSTFKLVEGSNKPAYEIFNYNGLILTVTNQGAAIIDNDKLRYQLGSANFETILPSKIFPDLLYAGATDGCYLIKIKKNKIPIVKLFTDKFHNVSNIVEDQDSTLWIKSYGQPVIHITSKINGFEKGFGDSLTMVDYKDVKGLPGNKWNLYSIQGRMMLATDKGIFKFDRKLKSFVADSILGREFVSSENTISSMIESNKGGYWILANTQFGPQLGKAILQKNGRYEWNPDPVFQRADLSTVKYIYADYDSVLDKESLWLSNDEGLIHYEPSITKNIDSGFSVLIRSVTVANDSLIYGGDPNNKDKDYKIIIPFSKNDIRFEFSATSYDKPESNLYQYILEGADDKWSNWRNETKKDYTNLSGGTYIFRVRAKNIYGIISNEAVFSFKVLPPWYFSWWAIAAYVLFILFGIYLTDRIMRARIIRKEQDKAKLREADLIKKQAEELETVDKLVRVVNNAEDIDTLFNSLLVQTVSFIPKAEKAAVFLLDHNDNKFHVAFTLGYNIKALNSISVSPEELKKRYTENSEEIEKGIYIISNTENLYGDEKFSGINKAASMLVMAVEWENKLEAYVVFDSFADKDSFDPSTARILNRFREHAVSAILKAQSIKTLQKKNEEIIKTQEQLVTQQKLASLGALTAGIAHEIKNPLNFVNNFAELSNDLLDEMETEFENDNKEEGRKIFKDLKLNLEKINQHGKRADSIVKGMLLHSRGSTGEKAPTDINDLLDQYVNLAYHGMRARDKAFNITIEKDYDETLEKINLVPQDISRVFLNLINNAYYAAYERKKNSSDNNFSPTLKVLTKNLNGKVEIRIADNGNGIPKDIIDKIFQPFFTTKPTGEGTGLGLSLSYDIITKVHGGEIKFESEAGEFTEFILILPKT